MPIAELVEAACGAQQNEEEAQSVAQKGKRRRKKKSRRRRSPQVEGRKVASVRSLLEDNATSQRSTSQEIIGQVALPLPTLDSDPAGKDAPASRNPLVANTAGTGETKLQRRKSMTNIKFRKAINSTRRESRRKHSFHTRVSFMNGMHKIDDRSARARTRARELMRQVNRERKEYGEFWSRICCGCVKLMENMGLPRIKVGQTRRKCLRYIRSPAIEALMLLMLLVDIASTVIELFIENALREQQQSYVESFCGFDPWTVDESFYCQGTRSAYSNSSLFASEIESTQDAIHVLQTMQHVMYVIGLVVITTFVIENFFLVLCLGAALIQHPLYIGDAIVSALSLVFLTAFTGSSMNCYIATLDEADSFYSASSDVVGDNECVLNVRFDTSDTCTAGTLSNILMISSRFLILFRFWRLIRIFQSILDLKKSQKDAAKSQAEKLRIARFSHATSRGQQRYKETDHHYEHIDTRNLDCWVPQDAECQVGDQLTSCMGIGALNVSTFKGRLVWDTTEKEQEGSQKSPAVAIKYFEHIWMMGEGAIDTEAVIVIQELSKHDRLAFLYGITQMQGNLLFVSEEVEGGDEVADLGEYMHGSRQQQDVMVDMNALEKVPKLVMSWQQQFQIASDIAEGLAWIHSHGLSHGNLIPANVLFCAPRCQGFNVGIESSEIAVRRRCLTLFTTIDQFDRKELSILELQKFLCSLGAVVNVQEVQSIFAQIDIDHSGSINFEEALLAYKSFTSRKILFRAKLTDSWLMTLSLPTRRSRRDFEVPVPVWKTAKRTRKQRVRSWLAMANNSNYTIHAESRHLLNVLQKRSESGWVAPEVLEGATRILPASDVYIFGRMMSMLTKCMRDHGRHKLVQKPHAEKNSEHVFGTLIARCMRRRPDSRPKSSSAHRRVTHCVLLLTLEKAATGLEAASAATPGQSRKSKRKSWFGAQTQQDAVVQVVDIPRGGRSSSNSSSRPSFVL